MSNVHGTNGWHHQMLQQWLLLILKFAITREETDRTEILEQATALDSLNGNQVATFRYFTQTSCELCDAIRHSETEPSKARLKQYASNIDNPRLRQAFLGTVDLHEQALPQRSHARLKQMRSAALWRRLR